MTVARVLCGALVLWTAAAGAQPEISYRYLETSYQDIDIGVADGDGGAIGFSWLWREHWIVFGRYMDVSLEGSLNGLRTEANMEYIRAGAGYRNAFPWLKRTDWYVLVAYSEIDLDDFEDEPESGEDFELGLRHAFTHDVEINAAARYVYSNIDAIDLLAGEAGWRLGGVWQVTHAIALTAGYEDIDEYNELSLGLRGSW